MKKLMLATVAAAVSLTSLSAFAKQEITVYTAFEIEQIRALENAFQMQHPEIKLNFMRDSTSVVTARLLAEKENPQADVIWGLAATSMMVLDKQDLLAPYAPVGLEKLDEKFRDSREVPHWIGMDAWIAGICFNTIEAKKHNLEAPTSWADLTKPEYQGHIIMPNPASSGTGFLDVSAWLQQFGDEKGWAYMEALHKNIARYTHSGSAPCNLAATGEAVMGVSFAFRGATLMQQGAPIDMIYPSEGVGWDMEAAAIVDGTDKVKAAQTLIDFAASEAANKVYNQFYPVIAISELAQPVAHYPTNAPELMIDNDFVWASDNYDYIINEWVRRFDGKSDAK
ncbi:putative 2-aminoethylphosphonate ABC transporter substrate-binding protein [Vibrio sp. 10N.286.49.B3]|uniref:putative 2-aminoethylphosphonate ABC transporter substrate-binding protein n=1 Tax=Vibrio sp. 10N.286.49.B3 TaxID=1880855 RepID=UPI000C84D430|nr:putative 2-aminoethylphosphonate ABC transporter substrate-binding protein [Vibrio sp. 10N.286.49.B3]PMH46143.1 putative 2-aminoethylphosphonate ABC transporter substrate-binding protein [Vibrio sp. 10N.286.49.B3]